VENHTGHLGRCSGACKVVYDLIMCISQLPPVITQSGRQLCGYEPRQRVWEDTPCLGISLRDEWNGESYLSVCFREKTAYSTGRTIRHGSSTTRLRNQAVHSRQRAHSTPNAPRLEKIRLQLLRALDRERCSGVPSPLPCNPEATPSIALQCSCCCQVD
jgi:hypothetical protein